MYSETMYRENLGTSEQHPGGIFNVRALRICEPRQDRAAMKIQAVARGGPLNHVDCRTFQKGVFNGKCSYLHLVIALVQL